jgi:hypothetical protein
MVEAVRHARRNDITVTKAAPGPEEERLDRAFWAAMTPDERVELAWQMTLEIWELKGWNPGEPGLRRPVARVVRG